MNVNERERLIASNARALEICMQESQTADSDQVRRAKREQARTLAYENRMLVAQRPRWFVQKLEKARGL